jgi:sugar lactone lactonase YvrE
VRTRRVVVPIVVALLTFAVASYALWRRAWSEPAPPPLESNWEAVVSVLAGDGVSGMRDGDADHARFSDPFGVASGADGSLYVADAGDAQRIRRIAPDGVVSTVAGGQRGYADGAAALARFDTPSGLAIDDGGVLYVADTGNNAIRRVTADGVVMTVAGGDAGAARDGAERPEFNGPVGVAVDTRGRVIVADTYNDRIRAIDPDGTVTTIAGSERGWIDGAASEARFDTPCGVAVDADGTIYVADTGNGAVRRISRDGQVTTVYPSPADAAFRPIGIAAGPQGVLYVAGGDRVIELAPGRGVRTLAGSGPGFAEGVGGGARIRAPSGVAVVRPGRLVITDTRNALLRVIAARSQVELRLPASPWIRPEFDAESFALLPMLWPFDTLEGPFEVAGTMGESRGGDGTERFHAGIDVSGDQGMAVFAIRDGMVASPIATAAFGTLNESIRIGPIAYVHLRVGRRFDDDVIDRSKFVPSYDLEGRLVQMRVKRGARFRTGDRIGTLNAFNHAHLNVGWPGEEHNPLRFRLVQFEDTVPPTIAAGGITVLTEAGDRITKRHGGRLAVSGRVQVVVDAWDQVDGNETRRRLGLYRLGYQVLQASGAPAPGFEAPRITMVFDRLGADEEAPRIVFAPGSGIPFYGRRRTRFLYVVTNRLSGGIATHDVWDTTTLPPGDYTLRIIAQDVRGNEAMLSHDLPVTIEAPGPSPSDPAGDGTRPARLPPTTHDLRPTT